MTTAKSRLRTVWLLVTGLACLLLPFGTEAVAQQAAAITVGARVVTPIPVLGSEVLGELVEGLNGELDGLAARRGLGTMVLTRRGPFRDGLSLVSATRECARQGNGGCLVVVKVEFLRN